jgi:Flp pilus assembly protein CpaB
MKASSMFAMTVAGLLGLGAVAGAKYAGIFDKNEVKSPAPAPPVKILVASQNIFEGMAVTSTQVKVRELTSDEKTHYDKNKEKYLPALVAAAHMRVAAQSIQADTPLMKEHFQTQELPEEVSARMNRYMRALNVAIPKERCNGGLLRVGEYVDVFITSQIVGAPDTEPTIQTACLARGVKIIVKRNNLWSALVSNPGDLPINYTLATNPYRAALIEFAKTAGNLTLMPVPMPLEEQVKRDNNIRPVFSDPNSNEYREEDDRVVRVEKGEMAIGGRDLERIFRLLPLAIPMEQTVTQDVIQHFVGVTQHRHSTLPKVVEYRPAQVNGAKPLPNTDGKVKPAGGEGFVSSLDRPAYGYRFYLPDVLVPKTKGKPGSSDCPECEAAAREAAARKKTAKGG